MSVRNITFDDVTLTDTGVVTINPSDNIEKDFEGTVNFTVESVQTTGTTDGDVQLQSSNDGFVANVVNEGSTVALVAGAVVQIPYVNSTNKIPAINYRIQITGVGTQSTELTATYTRKTGKGEY